MEKDKVLVTGYGPFKEHKINASWEAVKLLRSLNTENIDLVVEEIPVTYKDVEQKVKDLWKQHNPVLVMHVGVSSLATKITLETQANRCGYLMTDSTGKLHPTGECCPLEEGCDTIHCAINCQKICNEINNENKNIICTSEDAGRYLCEYIFYKSLNIDNNRTIFVHVPPLNKPFSAEELANGLLLILKAALKQIEASHCE